MLILDAVKIISGVNSIYANTSNVTIVAVG